MPSPTSRILVPKNKEGFVFRQRKKLDLIVFLDAITSMTVEAGLVCPRLLVDKVFFSLILFSVSPHDCPKQTMATSAGPRVRFFR